MLGNPDAIIGDVQADLSGDVLPTAGGMQTGAGAVLEPGLLLFTLKGVQSSVRGSARQFDLRVDSYHLPVTRRASQPNSKNIAMPRLAAMIRPP